MKGIATLAVVCLCAHLAAGSFPEPTQWQLDPNLVGNWFDAANWTDGVPTQDQWAYIRNDGTAAIFGGRAAANSLQIGSTIPNWNLMPLWPASGHLRQCGGALTVANSIVLSGPLADPGTYELLGGRLAADSLRVAEAGGSGRFRQDGGSCRLNTRLRVGGIISRYGLSAFLNSTLGLYELNGGGLVTPRTDVGVSGRGVFTQTGGRHTVSELLTIGGPNYPTGSFDIFEPIPLLMPVLEVTPDLIGSTSLQPQMIILPPPPSEGRYEMIGGRLDARQLRIGDTGRLQQTGGRTRLGYLAVDAGGACEYLGGRLRIDHGLDLLGSLDLGGRRVRLEGSGLLNFSKGDLSNAERARLNVRRDSLVIFPEGFDPKTAWGRFTSRGMVHYAGSDLVIGRREGVRSGWGTIDDFVDTRGYILTADPDPAADPLDTYWNPYGERTRTESWIDMLGGVYVHAGTVALGAGRVVVPDSRSGIREGRLSAASMEVASYIQTFHADGTVEATLPGRFRQDGGCVELAGHLSVRGSYEIHQGWLSADSAEVGGSDFFHGQASFLQTGGAVDFEKPLRIGGYIPYVLNSVEAAVMPSCIETLPVGPIPKFPVSPTEATYTMTGGSLSVRKLTLDASTASALFQLSGGKARVEGTLTVWDRNARCVLSGGSLEVSRLETGNNYSTAGNLELGPEARINVSESVFFGKGAFLNAEAGSTIHITGPHQGPVTGHRRRATFDVRGTDAEAMSGLADLTLIFEGGGEHVATLEVAGRDLGDVSEGFGDGGATNFALDVLQIGGADVAEVQLIDLVDNNPHFDAPDALYVRNLIVGPGSHLDLNGLNIYYRTAEIAPDAVFSQGSVGFIPEPATAALMIVGLGLTALRRRRREMTLD